MGLGVLEDPHLAQVPGTATLSSRSQPHAPTSTTSPPQPQTSTNHAYLKTQNGIILHPQPTASSLDPLNWPLRRRDTITAILCLASLIASTLSPLLAADTVTLAVYFERSFTDIALLTGWHLLGVGIAGFVFVASARVWGKRHLFILGSVVIILSSVWGGASNQNYASLAAARFFQGVGLAPFEALVNAAVGDLYFIHERGKRMAGSNLCLFGGAFFTPVIVGRITEGLGWQWCFYFVAIFEGVLLPALVLFVPETAFVREVQEEGWQVGNGDGNGNGRMASAAEGEKEMDVRAMRVQTSSPTSQSEDSYTTSTPESNPPTSTAATNYTPPQAPPLPSKSSLRLALPNRLTATPFYKFLRRTLPNRLTATPFYKLLLRPLPLFFHPAILWACLIQGTFIGWTVFIGVILALIALVPPLIFSEVQVGYLYTGAFLGALVGFLLAGVLADSSASWLARRNGGVYEPEFRLILVIPQLVLGCAGLYGFGITASNVEKFGWFWPDFFFALEVAGMVLGAVASSLYVVDAYPEIAVEAFTCMIVFKNVFSFGLTFSAFGWLGEGGIQTTFTAIASVQVAICCLSIPMYVFGKRNRSFFARHDLLALARLR